jgi:hypothetical protein
MFAMPVPAVFGAARIWLGLRECMMPGHTAPLQSCKYRWLRARDLDPRAESTDAYRCNGLKQTPNRAIALIPYASRSRPEAYLCNRLAISV